MKIEKLNDDMEDYGKFERMRQTWSHDGATFTKEKKAYNIIMKNGNLKDSDIKAIKNDIAQRGISDTAECKKYFDYLDTLYKNLSFFSNSHDNQLFLEYYSCISLNSAPIPPSVYSDYYHKQ